MATTRLSDVIVPVTYDSYGFVPDPITLNFLLSPAVRQSPYLNDVANRAGGITTIPFWNDLDATTDPNISTDNPADIAVPDKIGASAWQVRLADYNKSWSATDLASDMAGSNAMTKIKARTNAYWSKEMQRFLAAIAKGIAENNVASNASDMVNKIALETTVGQGANNVFSHNSVIDTVATIGEFFGDLAAAIMPMTVYWNLVKQDAISFTTPSSQGIVTKLPYYGGAAVFPVANNLLSRPGTTSGTVFTTILCGPGAFGWGEGTPLTPSETFRNPEQGNGGGVDTLYERVRWCFAVNGYSWTNASVAGIGPTSAEWALPANWQRKIKRQSIPLAFLQSNG